MKTKTIPWSLSVILLLAIIGQHIYFTNIKKQKPIVLTNTVKKDTTIYKTLIPATEISYQDTGSFHLKLIPAKVDTPAVIADYFTKHPVKRVLKDDSSAYIALNDSIFQNRLTASILEFKNRKPDVVVEKIYPNRLYLGGQTSFTNDHPEKKLRQKLGFGFVGTYTFKRCAVGASYDIVNDAYTASVQYSFK